MKNFEFPFDPGVIAIAGDWHANSSYSTRAIRWAHKQGAKAILHVGDFGFRFSPGFLNALTNELERLDMHLLFVDGNHDDHDWLNHQPLNDDGVRPLTERIAHLPRGYRWYWREKRWMALGGAHSVDRQFRTPGSDWWLGETLSYADVERAVYPGQVDYLVTHDRPLSAELPGITRESGLKFYPLAELLASDEHARMVQEVVDATMPERQWCGHFHLRADVPVVRKDGGETLLTVLDMDGSRFEDNMEILDLGALA